MDPPIYPLPESFAPERYARVRVRVISLCGAPAAAAIVSCADGAFGAFHFTATPPRTSWAPLVLAQRELALVILTARATTDEAQARLTAWRKATPVNLGSRVIVVDDTAAAAAPAADTCILPPAGSASFADRARALLVRFTTELMAAVPGLNAQLDGAGVIVTPGDADHTGLSGAALAQWQKKQAARREKQRADILLLQGNLAAAMPLLATALRALRIHSDALWVAGALESMAVTAHLQFASGDPQQKLPDLFNRYREAALAYARVKEAGILRVDVLLRLAACVLSAGLKSELTRELSPLFEFEALDSATEDTLLNLLALAHLHVYMRMPRKAAFYYHEAAFIYVRAYAAWDVAFELMLSVTHAHGMQDLQPALEGRQPDGALAALGRHRRIAGWPMLQARLLYDLSVVAGRSAEPARQSRIVGYFTQRIVDQQARDVFLPAMLSELQLLPLSNLSPFVLQGIPSIGALSLAQPQPSLGSFPVAVAQNPVSTKQSVFIFSALRRDAKQTAPPSVNFVCGEVLGVTVQLYNPLATELVVEQLRLVAEEPASFVPRLLPYLKLSPSEKLSVTLQGSPVRPGPLALVGVAARTLHIESLFRVATPLCGDVLPPLPLLTLEAGNPAQFDAVHAVLLAGESRNFVWALENKSPVPAKCLGVTLSAGIDKVETIWIVDEPSPPSSSSAASRQPVRLVTPAATFELASLEACLPLLPGQRCAVRVSVSNGKPGPVALSLLLKYGEYDWRPPARLSPDAPLNAPAIKYHRQVLATLTLDTQPALKAYEASLFVSDTDPVLLFQCQNETSFALEAACTTSTPVNPSALAYTLLQSYGIANMTVTIDSSALDRIRQDPSLLAITCVWRLPSQGRAGTILVPVSSGVQQALLAYPGALVVTIAGPPRVLVDAGSVVSFRVQVVASQGVSASKRALRISLRANQDFQTGANDPNVHGKIAWLGPMAQIVSPLDAAHAGEVIEREFSALFLCPGPFVVTGEVTPQAGDAATQDAPAPSQGTALKAPVVPAQKPTLASLLHSGVSKPILVEVK